MKGVVYMKNSNTTFDSVNEKVRKQMFVGKISRELKDLMKKAPDAKDEIEQLTKDLVRIMNMLDENEQIHARGMLYNKK